MPERVDRRRDEARDRGRAVHAGEDADVVARAGLAVGAAVALEGGALLSAAEAVLVRVLGEAIVALELGRPSIVLVYAFAGRDVLAAKPMICPNF